MPMHIEQLYTYPIKSLRGVALPSVNATQTGFAYDRHFMLWDVNKSENLHIGLRPALCLFSTRLTPEADPTSIEVQYGLGHVFDQPSKAVEPSTLSVPLAPDTNKLKQVTVTMHRSPCLAYDMGDTYSEWFGCRLGYPVRLLYIGDYRRKVMGNMAQGVGSSSTFSLRPSLVAIPVVLLIGLASFQTNETWLALGVLLSLGGCLVLVRHLKCSPSMTQPMITFSDHASYLVISTRSYQDVNDRLPEDEEMDITKFRANIVVSGAKKAYEEDFWAELRIRRSITMKLTHNCARCNSLNVDYATGRPGQAESGKILKKLSKDRRVDQGMKWSPIFGRYGFLTRASDCGDPVVLKVGDEVEVTSFNSEHTVVGKLPPTWDFDIC